MTDKKPASQPSTPAPFSRMRSRRSFVQSGFALVAAGWAGWLTQGVLFPPTPTQVKPVEIPLADLPVGGTKAITYEGKAALVMRTADGVTALSLVCTHLGCIVQWQPGKEQFYCACHTGYYDRDGDVVSGPPPLPLDRLPVRLLADKVIVGELL